ncbi:acetyl-CoA carboxylase biotin carboxyl carrier protein [Reyranella sp. CPCC 100927]|uniref:acetyl-CoA carboxylase biotin carboxyl carrier protein n=1 Tax=Reyranella sp. CPCC 100927 TaxID=2599616 RepID=UPI0011B77824|nr:acetyl-CoA carboxylase biotin carboxyl carrier protein [Reyranella sp. CPCC 100927]TWT00715.1 acetyl-CoA carboxylase biotin carboxyl carrier protein [Reyranella sp. CPCC 100927]
MSKNQDDLDLVRKLAGMLSETGLSEIEYEVNNRRIRVSRTITQVAAPMMLPGAAIGAALPGAAASAAAAADDSNHPGAVKSPMVGTAYLAPEPGKPAFVAVGDKVAAGQTLLIIEAMKTFNPIKATKAGTVTKVVVENAQPVEFGQVLMVVE